MFRFGWYVFLMAKGKLLPAPVDFVKALHLLLACVNVLLVHSPPALLRIKLLDVLGAPFALSLIPWSHYLLQLLCMSSFCRAASAHADFFL